MTMSLDLRQYFPLKKARMHEVCGPASWTFAAVAAGLGAGKLLWIRESWGTAQLNPVGLSRFFDPGLLHMALVKKQADGLAIAEEALRSGDMPLVVIELTEALGLVAARRLLLAAKTGGGTGLCLVPEGSGSNAAETRWRCSPVFDTQSADSTLMKWELIKNKSGTLCDWHVRWDPHRPNPAHRLAVVSPPVD